MCVCELKQWSFNNNLPIFTHSVWQDWIGTAIVIHVEKTDGYFVFGVLRLADRHNSWSLYKQFQWPGQEPTLLLQRHSISWATNRNIRPKDRTRNIKMNEQSTNYLRSLNNNSLWSLTHEQPTSLITNHRTTDNFVCNLWTSNNWRHPLNNIQLWLQPLNHTYLRLQPPNKTHIILPKIATSDHRPLNNNYIWSLISEQ